MSDDIAPANAPTPILGLNKPAVDGDIDIWGDLTNANWDLLDKALLTTGGVMTGALQAFNGTLAAPGYAIGGANTGLYRSGTSVGLSLQGAAAWSWAPGGATAGVQLDMATHALINLAAPANNADAATKAYVDAHAWQEAPNNTTTYGRRAVAWAPVVPFSPRGSIAVGYGEPANIVANATLLSMFATHSNVGFNIYYDGSAWRYLANGPGKLESFDGTNGILTWFGFGTGTAGNVATALQLAQLDAAGDFTITGQLHCAGGDVGISATNAGSYLVLGGAPGPQVGGTFVLNGGGRPSYSHEWYYYVTRTMTLDVNGNLSMVGTCSAASYPGPSDERIKKNIQPWTARGLADVIQLQPCSYQFNGEGGMRDDGITRYGVIAQEAQPFLPEAVTVMEPATHPDLPDPEPRAIQDQLAFDNGTLLFAIINAIKEISARLVALETAMG